MTILYILGGLLAIYLIGVVIAFMAVLFSANKTCGQLIVIPLAWPIIALTGFSE